MKKLVVLVVSTLLAVTVLAACSSDDRPSWANEADSIGQARQVIEWLNDSNYDRVVELSNGLFTVDALQTSLSPILSDLGDFQEYGDVATEFVDENEQDFVAVGQAAVYENATVVFTISFYEGGELCGLYVK